MPDSDAVQLPQGLSRKSLYKDYYVPYFDCDTTVTKASLSTFYAVLKKHFTHVKFPKAFKKFR